MTFIKGNKGYWLGKKRSKETNKKISEAHKGKILTENHKMKIKESAKNNPNYGMRNKHQSVKARIKIGLGAKGRKPWNYLDGNATKRNRLNTYVVHKIWCNANNFYRIPDGMIIHHLDLNPKNNHPENLLLMPKSYHSKMHNEISKILIGRVSVWQGL